MTLEEPNEVDVLEARARALARPVDDHTTVAVQELLVMSVGPAAVAVEAGRVREVLAPDRLARVPGGEHVGLALRNVRGDVLAVVDLGTLLGVVPAASVLERWVVVVDDAAGSIGVLVDDVKGLAGAEAVGPLPTGEGNPPAGLVAGVTPEGICVLDADALFGHTTLLGARAEMEPGAADQEGRP